MIAGRERDCCGSRCGVADIGGDGGQDLERDDEQSVDWYLWENGQGQTVHQRSNESGTQQQIDDIGKPWWECAGYDGVDHLCSGPCRQ